MGGIQAPTTVQNQTQLSPLNQIAGLIAALGGQSGTTGLLGQLGITGGLQGLIGNLKDAFGGNTLNMPVVTEANFGTNGLTIPGLINGDVLSGGTGDFGASIGDISTKD